MEKKMSSRNDHKKLRNISGDTTNVPYFWIRIGLHIESIKNPVKSLAKIPNPYEAGSNSDYKCNTHRYGIFIF
jgi:hypothetical protein